MRITEITVTFGQTHNLGNYSNVRPELRLTAALDEGEDPAAARAQLLAECKAFVYEAIDEALEDNEQAAKYSDESRYQLVYTTEQYQGKLGRTQLVQPPEQLLVIFPQGVKLQGRNYADPYLPHRKLRLDHARRVAAEWLDSPNHAGYRLVECLTVDDVAQLPAWLTSTPAPEPPAEEVPAGDTEEPT